MPLTTPAAPSIRVQPFMEIFNALNMSTVLTVNETIGPNFGTPAAIVSARRAQFGATIDW